MHEGPGLRMTRSVLHGSFFTKSLAWQSRLKEHLAQVCYFALDLAMAAMKKAMKKAMKAKVMKQ